MHSVTGNQSHTINTVIYPGNPNGENQQHRAFFNPKSEIVIECYTIRIIEVEKTWCLGKTWQICGTNPSSAPMISGQDRSSNQQSPKIWTRPEPEKNRDKNRPKNWSNKNYVKYSNFVKKQIYSCASIWIQTIIHKYA